MPLAAAAETARKMATLYDLFMRQSPNRQQQIYYARRYRYWSTRAEVLERRTKRGHRCRVDGAGPGLLHKLACWT